MQQLKIGQSPTIRETPSFDIYLKKIGKESMISAEEEVELARRIKAGDREARDKLVKANLRFVVSVAKQYQNRGVPLPDLINEGNIGLIKAAEMFDETKGFKFISYAVWWIRQAILNAINDQSTIIRIPANQSGTRQKVNRAMSRFEQENQRTATIAELADLTGLEEDKIVSAMKLPGYHVSVDAPFPGEEEGTLIDVIANEDSPLADVAVIKNSLSQDISRVLGNLNDRERQVLQMHFGINGPEMKLEEIAEVMGVSRERVRQIKEKALKRLRNSGANLLKSYLD